MRVVSHEEVLAEVKSQAKQFALFSRAINQIISPAEEADEDKFGKPGADDEEPMTKEEEDDFFRNPDRRIIGT